MYSEFEFHVMAYVSRRAGGYAYGCKKWMEEALGIEVTDASVHKKLKAWTTLKLLEDWFESPPPDVRRAGHRRHYFRLNAKGLGEYQELRKRILVSLNDDCLVESVTATGEPSDTLAY